MESQISPNSQSNIRKDKKAVGITFPDFKRYYIKAVWYCIKTDTYTSMEHNKTSEINPHLYSQLIYDIGRNIQWGKDILFNKWYWIDTSKNKLRVD